MDEQATRVVRVSLTEKQWEEFKSKANAENRTRPLQIRQLILNYIGWG